MSLALLSTGYGSCRTISRKAVLGGGSARSARLRIWAMASSRSARSWLYSRIFPCSAGSGPRVTMFRPNSSREARRDDAILIWP